MYILPCKDSEVVKITQGLRIPEFVEFKNIGDRIQLVPLLTWGWAGCGG